MHAASLWADEWTFEVNPGNFGERLIVFVLHADVLSDAGDTAQNIFGICGNSGGDKRCGSKTCKSFGHGLQRGGIPFHYVAAASAMNMNINEARNDDTIRGNHFARAGRKGHRGTWADRFDYAVTNQNAGVRNFGGWSKSAAGVEERSGHWGVLIVTEKFRGTKQNG